MHWAKFYLTKAGLLESPRRGRFVISAAGRKLLSSPPERLDTKYLLSIPSFRDFYKSDQTDELAEVAPQADASKSTPEEVIETAYKATQVALQTELLDRILQNSPTFFETVIVDLLVAMGYGGSRRNAATQLGRTGDGGVDGVITRTFSVLIESMSKPSATERARPLDGQKYRLLSAVWWVLVPAKASW